MRYEESIIVSGVATYRYVERIMQGHLHGRGAVAERWLLRLLVVLVALLGTCHGHGDLVPGPSTVFGRPQRRHQRDVQCLKKEK